MCLLSFVPFTGAFLCDLGKVLSSSLGSQQDCCIFLILREFCSSDNEMSFLEEESPLTNHAAKAHSILTVLLFLLLADAGLITSKARSGTPSDGAERNSHCAGGGTQSCQDATVSTPILSN